MSVPSCVRCAAFVAAIVAVATAIPSIGVRTHAQSSAQTDAGLPNPYRLLPNWVQTPRKWGVMGGAAIDRDGQSIWVTERCGGQNCIGSDLSPILKFDPSGKLVSSFGAGMLVYPHGMYVDRDGNLWVTDGQANAGKGQQVFKFSPEGKVLLTLGKAGVSGTGPDTFNKPSAVVTAPNGDIFIADGHGGADSNARIVKFSKEGKFLKTWGHLGSAPGDIDTPHDIAMDVRGRIFEADRGNDRIQIFDQEGTFIEQWKQYGPASGLFITADDVLYAADANSSSKSAAGVVRNPGHMKGIRFGSAKDGTLKGFILDSEPMSEVNAGAEDIAVDGAGNVYGAANNRMTLEKYVRK